MPMFNWHAVPWISWHGSFPDWPDSGRRVQAYDDGRIIEGKLTIDDVMSDGEGDEWPIWMIELPDGFQFSFVDCEFYRFVDEEPAPARGISIYDIPHIPGLR